MAVSEDLEVRKDVFLSLQEDAKRKTVIAGDKRRRFRTVVDAAVCRLRRHVRAELEGGEKVISSESSRLRRRTSSMRQGFYCWM